MKCKSQVAGPIKSKLARHSSEKPLRKMNKNKIKALLMKQTFLHWKHPNWVSLSYMNSWRRLANRRQRRNFLTIERLIQTIEHIRNLNLSVIMKIMILSHLDMSLLRSQSGLTLKVFNSWFKVKKTVTQIY